MCKSVKTDKTVLIFLIVEVHKEAKDTLETFSCISRTKTTYAMVKNEKRPKDKQQFITHNIKKPKSEQH